jgi:hypothetical protein
MKMQYSILPTFQCSVINDYVSSTLMAPLMFELLYLGLGIGSITETIFGKINHPPTKQARRSEFF